MFKGIKGRKSENGNYDLWVIRWNRKKRELMNSYPCNTCLAEIKKHSQIRRVFYSNGRGEIVMEKSKDMEFLYETRAQKNIRLGVYERSPQKKIKF